MQRGVYVLGMHRSGTSAATRLVNLLGLTLADTADLLIPKFDNPTGHWESWSLMTLNDRLLALLGGDWTCPPRPERGWHEREAFVAVRPEAAELFDRLHASEPWVWKDPRNCVLLPFWQDVLATRGAAVLVHRNPLEVAASLGERDSLPPELVTAMWERYTRSALAVAESAPVLVAGYDTILADPLGWTEALHRFLHAAGIATGPVPEAEVTAFVEPGLRHARASAADFASTAEATSERMALLAALERLEGAHSRFAPPALPPEAPDTERVLAERRRELAATREA